MHNLKVENYVLLGRLAEDLSLDTASEIAPWGWSEEVREEPGYIGVQTEKRIVDHPKITAN